MNFLPRGSWPLSAGVYITGQTPSLSPLDRAASFTRHEEISDVTYREVDLFTVIMSLDLQPDITCDRQISAADSAALALDWNREWLIPASTNAWFPVKIFKDVAMSGIYTVTAPTNIAVRYNGVVLTPGGETVSFPQSQSQETLEVQVAAPGDATLTLTFTGTGTATNYNCSTYVNITAWGVDIGVDADYDGDSDAQDDPLEETQGGLVAVGASVLTPLDISLIVPQSVGVTSLTLEALSGGDKIRVWTGNTTNSAAITLPKTWAAGEPVPSRIWVQGLNHSDTSRDVSLRLNGFIQGVASVDVVNLTVVQVVTEAVAELPPDRFRKIIGVGEIVKLSCIPSLLSVVVPTWVNVGGGTLQEIVGIENTFIAPDHNAIVTVTAKFGSSVSCPIVFQTIEPSSILFENLFINEILSVAPPNANYFSVKYNAKVYFQPDTVNFGRITLIEGYAVTQTEPGYWRDYPPPPHGEWVVPRNLVDNGSTWVAGKGTMANWAEGDEITGSTLNAVAYPIRDGYAWWDIPWSFRVGDGAFKTFHVARQDFRVTGSGTNGTFRITKGASGAEISTGDTTAHFITQ